MNGEKGEKGIQGEIGEQGPQGEKGDTGPAAIVRSIETILIATDWVDGQITISSEYIQTHNYIVIGLHNSITLEQYDALSIAKVICTSQNNGSITLKCLGTVPSIDIPVVMIIEGEQLDTIIS